MAVSSGFFDSLDGDRMYNAQQFGTIFEGIITDGVYQHIGARFAVTAGTGTSVNVGTGRAWLRETWTINDSVFPITMDDASPLLDRIDMLVIEVNKTIDVRKNEIKVVSGVASSNPVAPTLLNSSLVRQYPIAEIFRPKGSTAVTQSNITPKVGTSVLPFVTGVLETMSIDNQVAHWESQWADWLAKQTSETSNAMANWTSSNQAAFENWFSQVENTLAGDAATNLAMLVAQLATKLDTLANEYSIFDTLTDNTDGDILDSAGSPISGKVKFALAEPVSFRHLKEAL